MALEIGVLHWSLGNFAQAANEYQGIIAAVPEECLCLRGPLESREYRRGIGQGSERPGHLREHYSRLTLMIGRPG